MTGIVSGGPASEGNEAVPESLLGIAERKRLARLADALIPGGRFLPSASDARVHLRWIDHTLAARPDLYPVVSRVVATPGEASDVLARLVNESPAVFEDFAFAVAGAYFLNPKIRKLLGYPGTKPAKNPAYSDEAEHYLSEDLLAPVLKRGPIYRPTPPET
jgi:hypothetical protein